jgi:hypothetical protein
MVPLMGAADGPPVWKILCGLLFLFLVFYGVVSNLLLVLLLKRNPETRARRLDFLPVLATAVFFREVRAGRLAPPRWMVWWVWSIPISLLAALISLFSVGGPR